MAKKVGLDYDQMHFMRIEAYTRKIQQLYLSAIREAATISEGVKFDDSKPFSFDHYPKTKQRIDRLIAGLNSQMFGSIQDMTHDEWLAATYKSDALVDYIAGKTKLPTSILEKYKSRNLEALSSFQQRKINGLNLSDRVWNYTNQFKGELELGFDIGLGEGKSAAELSRDLRSYLNDPDKLFRRVRDKHGNLVLSKNAQKYNPGAGVYRSSYKNAMRLTRTEVNMAYRTSDYERNQQLDFVVGFEVRRSNHVFSCPVCESLKGKYPKTFKFVGWHPQCRCHCIAITSTQEEFIEHEKKLLAGEESVLKSKNEVSDVPDNFKGWLATNKDRLYNAKSKPYFISDNEALISINSFGFRPSKTVAEAIAYGRQNGLSYSGEYKSLDVDQINAINESLIENKRLTIPEIWKTNHFDNVHIISDNSGGLGRHLSASDHRGLLVNRNSFTKENAKAIATDSREMESLRRAIQRKERNTLEYPENKTANNAAISKYKKQLRELESNPFSIATNTLKSQIDHEIGHVIQDQMQIAGNLAPYKLSYKGYINLVKDMKENAYRLGRYAATNDAEYFAESWAAFINGRKDLVSDYMKSLFKLILK